MTVLVSIRFEENGQDREYQAILLAVPRAGELVSFGSRNNLQHFEVQTVWHSQIDDKSEATLFCQRLPEGAPDDDWGAVGKPRAPDFRRDQEKGTT